MVFTVLKLGLELPSSPEIQPTASPQILLRDSQSVYLSIFILSFCVVGFSMLPRALTLSMCLRGGLDIPSSFSSQ